MGRVLVDQGDVVREGSNSGCNSMTHRSTSTRQTKRYRNVIIGVCMVSDMIAGACCVAFSQRPQRALCLELAGHGEGDGVNTSSIVCCAIHKLTETPATLD